jgi:hypothetical protein
MYVYNWNMAEGRREARREGYAGEILVLERDPRLD